MAVRAGQDGERCSECDQPIAAVDRFCGRCGEHLPPPPVASTDAPPGPPVPSTPPPSPATRRRLDRRTLLAGFGGLAIGGVLGAAIHRRLRSGPPRDEAGLPTAEVEVGDARDLAGMPTRG